MLCQCLGQVFMIMTIQYHNDPLAILSLWREKLLFSLVLYRSQQGDILNVVYKSKFYLYGQNIGTELLRSHLKILRKLPAIQFNYLKGITRDIVVVTQAYVSKNVSNA